MSAPRGVTGEVHFKSARDLINSAVLVQVKDGKFTFFKKVTPSEITNQGWG